VLEDVFSSSSSGTGFRIRAAQGRAADHGLSDHGFRSWAECVAATLFFSLSSPSFPDCRICGSPLIKVSRLPVCETCLIALAPLQGSYCTACGEAFDVPAYSDRFAADRGETERLEADRVEVEIRCLLSERTGPPFERAVADASDDGGLRDLIRLLKFPQVRRAAPVPGRMLADTIANLGRAMLRYHHAAGEYLGTGSEDRQRVAAHG
jgi:hypothetical protein